MRVLLVHDHRMFTGLLERTLREDDGIAWCTVERTAAAALASVRRERPDVVVFDHQLPDADGADLATQLHREHPDVGLMVLTCSRDEATLRALVHAGCSGIVTKDHLAHELVAALHTVRDGGAAVSPDLLELVLRTRREYPPSSITSLSAREVEVLRLLAHGLSNRAVAERLAISYHTVRNHVQHIITKLGVHSKLEAVAVATRVGLG